MAILPLCSTCVRGELHQKPFPKFVSKSTVHFEITLRSLRAFSNSLSWWSKILCLVCRWFQHIHLVVPFKAQIWNHIDISKLQYICRETVWPQNKSSSHRLGWWIPSSNAYSKQSWYQTHPILSPHPLAKWDFRDKISTCCWNW